MPEEVKENSQSEDMDQAVKTGKVSEQKEASEEDKTETPVVQEAIATPQASQDLKKKEKKHSWVLPTVILSLVAILIVAGGVTAAIVLQNQGENSNSNNHDDPGVSEDLTQEDLVGGGGGVLIETPKPVAKDDKLTLALLKLHNDGQNSCYSPLSIRYALEMLNEGASGETKKQLENLLGGMTATQYENIADRLSVANSLWINSARQGDVQEDYRKTLQSKYGADVKIDDFASAANINKWIDNKSFGMLKNVLQDPEVAGLQLALVNVLAIDMNWEREYRKESTSGQYFNYNEDLGDKNTKYAMMSIYNHGTDNTSLYYNLASEATVFAQDLKEYNGTQLQFVAIMPKDLQSYVESVSNADITKLLSGLRMAKGQNDTYEFSFNAYMPKFEITGGIDDLVGDLQELGVTDVFDASKADLKKMIGGDNFAIDSAIHKTKFDLSEEGIKAAAVTVLGGFGAGGDGPIPSSVSVVVSINKPFMYLVRDKATGEIWFIGTVYDPTHWDDVKTNYGYYEGE